jgi:hypothetical protein
MTAIETDARTRACWEQYGFCIDAGPHDMLYVYVKGGQDTDGAQLTHARLASPLEVHLWERSQFDQLGAMFGVVVPKVSLWSRFTAWVSGILGK